jgi:probable HAF family extracellular repeat protein
VNDRDQVIGTSQGASCSAPSHAFLWEKGVLQDLGTLGGSASEPTDINKHGQVVGWANTSDGSVHAFFWDQGSMEDLSPVVSGPFAEGLEWKYLRGIHIDDRGEVIGNTPGGGAFLWDRGVTQTLPLDFASGINDRGQVVGWASRDVDGVRTRRAVLWDAGTLTDLGTLPGAPSSVASEAVGISRSGWVFGSSGTAPRPFHGDLTTLPLPFRWRDGVMEDLGKQPEWSEPDFAALFGDDVGRVVGFNRSDAVNFVWQDGVWTQVLGPGGLTRGWVLDMNDDGAIVGIEGSRAVGRAFVWQGGATQYLGTTCYARPEAVNSRGVVVGYAGECPSPGVFSPHTPAMWVPANGGEAVATGP